MANNEVAVVEDSKAAQLYMATMLPGLEMLAQRKYDPKSWAQTVVLAIVESQALTKCLTTAEGKASLYHALKFAAATGLSMNPQEGKCALVPYAGKIQYQIMKNGLIDIALADPNVRNIRSLVVKERDTFRILQTLDGDTFEFEPHLTDRGEPIGYFAAVKMESGPSYVKYITKDEAEKHRDRYSSMYNSDKKTKSPWHKSFDGMAEKTVIKELLRTNHISSDLDILVGTDDKAEAEMIDITPAPSLEEQVVEEQPIIEAEKVEEAKEEPAEPVEASGEAEDRIDPPTEKGDISDPQRKKIYAMLMTEEIKGVDNDETSFLQRSAVSNMLGFSKEVSSMNNLSKAHAKMVIDILEARKK